jgi:hypothetical protein
MIRSRPLFPLIIIIILFISSCKGIAEKSIIIRDVTIRGEVIAVIFKELPDESSDSLVPVNTAVRSGTIADDTLFVDLVIPRHNTVSFDENGKINERWSGSGRYYVGIIPLYYSSGDIMDSYIFTGGGDSPVKVSFNKNYTALDFGDFRRMADFLPDLSDEDNIESGLTGNFPIDISELRRLRNPVSLYNVLSFGFNTVETQEFYDGQFITRKSYYLLNNPLYTNAEISEPLDYEFAGIRYELPSTSRARAGEVSNDLLRFQINDGAYTHSIAEDGKDDAVILVNTFGTLVRSYGDKRLIYYDIPFFELEHIYLSVFIKNIFSWMENRIADIRHNPNYEKMLDPFLIMFPHFTNHELAIIRNCLFAKKGYNFQSPYWNKIFNLFYSREYEGLYTEEEVFAQFTDDEKWLLDLILEYERKM